MKDLSTNNIYEIGSYLTTNLKLDDNKIKDIKLIMTVNNEYFKKIDEDIFYRLNKDEKDKEFIPSDNEIILTFPTNTIIIKKDAN